MGLYDAIKAMVPRIPGRTAAVLVDEVDSNHRNGTFAIPGDGIILLMDEHNPAAGQMSMNVGGVAFTRDTTGTPAAGQFFYDSELKRVICNTSDAGKTIQSLQYYSLGSVVRAVDFNTLLTAIKNLVSNKSDVLRVASSTELTAANAPNYDLAIVDDGTNPPALYVSKNTRNAWAQTAGSSAPPAGTLAFTTQPVLKGASVTASGWSIYFDYQNDGSANPVTIEQQLTSGGAWTAVTPIWDGIASKWRIDINGKTVGSYAHKVRITQGVAAVTSTTTVSVNLTVPVATVNPSNVTVNSMNVAGVVSQIATQGTVTKLRFVYMLGTDADEAAAVTAGRYVDLISPNLDGSGNYSASLSPLSMNYSTNYTVKVQVTQQSGDGVSLQAGNWSAGSGITTPALPVITGLVATPGDTQNTVSWNAGMAGAVYNLYWSTSPGVTKATGTKIAGVTSPKVHTGLINGVPIYYVVTQVVNGIESVESAQVSGTPVATILDNFNNSNLDATIWSTSVAGGGTVVEGTSGVTLTTTSASQGALLYRKDSFTRGTSVKTFTNRVKTTTLSAGNALIGLQLYSAATAPAAIASGTYNNGRLLWIELAASGGIRTFYINTSDTPVFTPAANALPIALNTEYDLEMSITATQFRMRILNISGGVLHDGGWINWSSAKSINNTLWVVCGDPYTDAYNGTMVCTKYTEA